MGNPRRQHSTVFTDRQTRVQSNSSDNSQARSAFGFRHSIEHDATGQVTPTNEFQRGKSDGKRQKGDHSPEVLKEGSANWLQAKTPHSLMLLAGLPDSALCPARKHISCKFAWISLEKERYTTLHQMTAH